MYVDILKKEESLKSGAIPGTLVTALHTPPLNVALNGIGRVRISVMVKLRVAAWAPRIEEMVEALCMNVGIATFCTIHLWIPSIHRPG